MFHSARHHFIVHCSPAPLRFGAVLFIVSLFIASCSLASDVTPPPGYEQVVFPTATQASIDFPASMPSTAAGATLYAQNCTRCHGVSGAGDGEFASQIEFPIPAFTDPNIAFTTTPQRWFSIITHGNLDRMMPPWSGSLTDVERWHLVAHLYSLSSNAEAGKAVYEANCASCHGESGLGDGPEAVGTLPNFTDQQFMSAKSNQEFFEALSQPEHDFSETLREEEQRAAIDYVRAFSFDAQPLEVTQGMVRGTITNGTSGGALPDEQEVELHLFDNFQEVGTLTTIANGNTFEFSGVELTPGRAIIATIRYNDVLYTSDVTQVTGEEGSFDLPILVYDSTTDDSAISIGRMHIVFDFNSSGTVQVGELLAIRNGGDLTLRPEAEGGPTIEFPLPSGYTSLTFQDGELGNAYLQTESGFADTLPIGPGDNARQILASFKLPYTDSLTFSQTLSYPAAEINILLPDAGVTISGNGLVDAGAQEMEGGQFGLYTLPGANAGETVTFTLSGRPTITSDSNAAPPITFDLRSALIGILALGLAVALAAYWWTGGSSEPTPAPATTPKPSKRARSQTARRDELLDAIAALDDTYEAGNYDEIKYREERERLKTELRKIVSSK
jgi:mono/diheme cytochrome c family protein